MFKASTSSSKPNSIKEIKDLDATLGELRTLSNLTKKGFYCDENYILELDSRYVSSVSIGLKMKSIHPHKQFRMNPYVIPRSREERHRTRSENADVVEKTEKNCSLVASMIDAVVSEATDEVQNIKKSKSLENVHLDEKCEPQSQPEIELVSTCIQKLKMAE